MCRLNLTPAQRHGLRRQLAAATDVRLYRRTLAVLEFDRGRSMADIADGLGVARQSVYNWVTAFARGRDPAALADAAGAGRPPLLDAGDLAWLRRLLSRSPQDVGYPATAWTVPLLRGALGGECGRPSDDTVRRALRRLGYVWKRPRYVLAPDPGREKKTAHPPADRGPARPECRAGGGRDRLAAVPAPAGGLVAAG